MTIKQTIGSLLRRVGLLNPLNKIRFWLLRPVWWVDAKNRCRFFRTFFKKGDLCFDVGANTGEFSEMLCSLGAHVVAIEPQPSCIDKVQCLIKDGQPIELVEAALGSSEGTAELFLAGDSSQISALSDMLC
jgi:2-polyprenyl-3-methyl-5-hydroxy-6-metoxy-1,4-benzoquinol methylase